MTKEQLTIDAIRQDLSLVARQRRNNPADWRLQLMGGAVGVAVILWLLVENLWISAAVLSVAVYQIIQYSRESAEYGRKQKRIREQLEQCVVSVSVEVLSHIAMETIEEPHYYRGSRSHFQTVKMFYFEGGTSWRVPNVFRHYEWSQEFPFTDQGLDNVSLVGDEFYVIRLQGYDHISYAYPCKFFTAPGITTRL